MAKPTVQIVNQLDVHGSRWAQRIRVDMALKPSPDGGQDTWINGNLPVEMARELWHDLGIALDTVDHEEGNS